MRADLTVREAATTSPRSLKTKGSIPWCYQVIEVLKVGYRRLEDNWQEVEQDLQELEAVAAWERIPPERPYGSLEAMLRAELGVGEIEFRHRIATAAQQHAAAATPMPPQEVGRGKAGPGRGKKTGNQITRFRGTDASYLARRIARERPDVLAQMQAGAFRSVRQAAIVAGIVRELSPLERAQRAYAKLTPSDQAAFRAWLDPQVCD
jgi:hypothetical protein